MKRHKQTCSFSPKTLKPFSQKFTNKLHPNQILYPENIELTSQKPKTLQNSILLENQQTKKTTLDPNDEPKFQTQSGGERHETELISG